MIKHKWIGAISVLLMAATVIGLIYACLNPAAFSSVTGLAAPAYVSVIDKTKIMDFQIIADEAEWKSMLENATAEEYITATVIINGTKIENVGIRPKGNSSLSTVASSSTTDRFSFKIEFDHYVTGQTWLGLDKIVVNNMQGDASYLKEYLSYDIMDYVGVEAPLYAFADIFVNGEQWGFYLAVEALEDSYAKRVYGNDHGKLYKPESMGMRGEGRMNEFIEQMQNDGGLSEPPQFNQQAPAEGWPQEPADNGEGQTQESANTDESRQSIRGNRGGMGGFGGMSSSGVSLQYIDDESSSYSAIFENSMFDTTENDYQRVIRALEKLSNGEDIENAVDVEAVLKYFAAHTVVVNLDSYVSNMGHNYYLYEDNGRLTILPWDYNLAFGGFQSGNASSAVNFPIDTPVSGVSLDDRPLLGKLLEVPEYMELYYGYLKQIVDGYFNSGLFEQTVDSMNELISSHVEADPSAFYDYSAYQTAVTEIKELGLLRAQSIEGQLNGTIPSTSEGQNAQPDKLVDASSVNISALGSQGGGGFGGGMPGGFGDDMGDRRQGGMGNMQGVDMNNMQRVMEIIQAAGENELTEEQLAQLKEIGLTDEQITQFKNMPQGNFGGMDVLSPEMTQGGMNTQDFRQDFTDSQSIITSGYDTSTWIIIGGCTALLFGSLAFASLFKRRRSP